MNERLEMMIKAAGGQTKVAKALRIDPKTVYRWLKSGQSPKFEDLAQIADMAKMSLDWLATGAEASSQGLIPHQSDPDFLSVPLYDAEASTGHESFIDYAPVKDRVPFTENFLRKLGRSTTDKLICVYARGDSMEPTISDGDIIMIDQRKRSLTPAIFAVTSEYGFWIKRLNPGVEGVEVISDNPSYKPLNIRHDLMAKFEILGQVIWVGHTP